MDNVFSHRLLPSISRERIRQLIQQFEGAVNREQDKSLSRRLTKEILEAPVPVIRRETMLQLARWCRTSGIYADGMMVAQRISEALFGQIIDRRLLNT